MRKSKKGADMLIVQNAAKTLLANIRFSSVDDPVSSLVLTSSVPNEGKTTVAISLAKAIATGGKRVLLVECDMRRRSLADALRVHTRAGLYAVLSGQVNLAQAVVSVGQSNLHFLDAEPHIPNPADIIASRRFERLVGVLENEYDFVIFDTPPVGTFVDAAVLSALSDATVLVVREGFTRRDDVLNAYNQLRKADANVIGVVLNDSENKSNEYYYAYYTKDGKRMSKGSPYVSEPQMHTAPASPSGLPAVRGRRTKG